MGYKMKNNKYAFTMIEMIFVIVVLGILASIAIPKFAATRTDAEITKGRADVAAIRSSIINERQTRLIKGDSSFVNILYNANGYFDSNGTASTDAKLLMYPIQPQDKDGHWHSATTTSSVAGASVSTYKYKILDEDTTFTYTQSDGKFTCSRTDTHCSKLID